MLMCSFDPQKLWELARAQDAIRVDQVYTIAFSLIVCVGNLLMAEMCSRVADTIGFVACKSFIDRFALYFPVTHNRLALQSLLGSSPFKSLLEQGIQRNQRELLHGPLLDGNRHLDASTCLHASKVIRKACR